ncbi:MAG: hypothetical protein CSA62_12230 [Planctomycetota bacterium]|nr:MAG: hypothetical protein CSA62_12230 [Planctomycetota bacterium]
MLERALGRYLPESYRNLLGAADGGCVGAQRFFGTGDQLRWLKREPRRARPRCSVRAPRSETFSSSLRENPQVREPLRLLPLAPLEEDVFEYLDLENGCVAALEAEGGADPIMLYRDLDNWALDALWDLHFESGDLSLAT